MQSQRMLFVVSFKLTKYALSFIFFYLMVLLYEPKVIGTVQFVIAFVSIFSFIFNLGFSIAHLKIYPEEENKSACIGTLLTYKTFFILISLFFYFSLLSLMNLEGILRTIMLIFIFDQIIQGINSSISNILIADNKVLKGTFPWIIVSLSKIILLSIGLFFFTLNELNLSYIYFISSLFHTGFLLIFIVPYRVKLPTRDLLKKYFTYTYPIGFSSMVLLLSNNIGIILINLWVSAEAVAFYYAGDHLSVFRTIIPNVVSLIMVSVFSKNIKEKNLEKNNQIIKNLSKYFCILWGGIILISLLYSDEIIIIFLSETYRPSVFVFNILILTHIIVINDIGIYTDLNARGLTKLFSVIKIIGEVYNIILIFLFIAPFGLNLGINGLALSILFRYLTYTPIVRFYLWKKYNYSYNFEIFLYLLAAFIVYLVNIMFASEIDFISHFYLIPVFVVINVILYLGILYIFRCLKKEDFIYLRTFLNIKSLINLFYEDLAQKNDIYRNES